MWTLFLFTLLGILRPAFHESCIHDRQERACMIRHDMNAWLGMNRNAWSGMNKHAWSGMNRHAWSGMHDQAWTSMHDQACMRVSGSENCMNIECAPRLHACMNNHASSSTHVFFLNFFFSNHAFSFSINCFVAIYIMLLHPSTVASLWLTNWKGKGFSSKSVWRVGCKLKFLLLCTSKIKLILISFVCPLKRVSWSYLFIT